jgi:hypothetical protein
MIMDIDIESLIITRHAKRMAQQRFNKYSKQVIPFFRKVLSKATYIGLTNDSKHLFTCNRVAVVISPDCKKIVTVMVNHRQKQISRNNNLIKRG